ncbi:uncharacterized protein LOC142775640 [Rhipicephalus microplus]|uniref:uncharacterized protein LOC142775640 n=1 Tax=Rhipicephalus microplus TaxID=6941 RepID=UPI003F6C34E9
MARVRDGVFTTVVKEDGRVRVEAQSGKSMVDALAKAQEVVENSMEGENLVIIHAELNDVLKGKDQNLQRQRMGCGSSEKPLGVCMGPYAQSQRSGGNLVGLKGG